uniref:Non-specific lipid-transfer protein n=1 Tax=Salix viminalis TaxID=40686 RepID=A0A6N2K5W3_SALVM
MDELRDRRNRMVTKTIRAEPLQPLRCIKNPGMCNAVHSSTQAEIPSDFHGIVPKRYGGASALQSAASTTADKKAACECIKSASKTINPNPQLAQALPANCEINLPCTVSPNERGWMRRSSSWGKWGFFQGPIKKADALITTLAVLDIVAVGLLGKSAKAFRIPLIVVSINNLSIPKMARILKMVDASCSSTMKVGIIMVQRVSKYSNPIMTSRWTTCTCASSPAYIEALTAVPGARTA